MKLRAVTSNDRAIMNIANPEAGEPLIGFINGDEVNRDEDESWVVVVDRDGLTITHYTETGSKVTTVFVSYPAARAMAEALTIQDVMGFIVTVAQ